MIGLDERDFDAPGVGHNSGYVHGQWVYPLWIYAKHMLDQVRCSIRAIDWAVLPIGGQIGVVVRMSVSETSKLQFANKSSKLRPMRT